jgi:hypothetical protein
VDIRFALRQAVASLLVRWKYDNPYAVVPDRFPAEKLGACWVAGSGSLCSFQGCSYLLYPSVPPLPPTRQQLGKNPRRLALIRYKWNCAGQKTNLMSNAFCRKRKSR